MLSRYGRTPLTVLQVLQQLFPRPVAEDKEQDETNLDVDVGDEEEIFRTETTGEPYDAWPLRPLFEEDQLGTETQTSTAAADDLKLELRRQPLPDEELGREILGHYARLPKSPFDVFAFAAYLMELSGAYHHVVPAPDRHGREPVDLPAGRFLWVRRKERRDCDRLAKRWRAPLDESDQEAVENRAIELDLAAQWWWQLVFECGAYPVYKRIPETNSPPVWWSLALKLLMLSDEAARGAGFNCVMGHDPRQPAKPEVPWFLSRHFKKFVDNPVAFTDSFSSADKDVVCVMPKARTTAVGCTLRSLSHNLAMLPSRGTARASWVPRVFSSDAAPVDNEFNILLVPYPYSVRDQDFGVEAGFGASSKGWGFFTCLQTWLTVPIDDDMVDFVVQLVADAKIKGASRIDAVVFPELALDYRTFAVLRSRLRQRIPSIRVLIAGLSTNEAGRHGNFVGVAAFLDLGPSYEDPDDPPYIETIREKHHRWQLDRAQIEAYALEGVLDPRRRWWEHINLLSRRVEFTVFHEGSVLAAMICEDLARVDPCQQLLRAIGPSLVIALLMDAPQLRTRWPARYATVLAEDPGSSVLTLTSRGLIARQRLYDRPRDIKIDFASKPVIALWRDDDSGIAEQIECGFDSQAVWLKLHGKNAVDLSLDGRSDDRTLSWILGKQREVSIRDQNELTGRFARLLGEADRLVRERIRSTSGGGPAPAPTWKH